MLKFWNRVRMFRHLWKATKDLHVAHYKGTTFIGPAEQCAAYKFIGARVEAWHKSHLESMKPRPYTIQLPMTAEQRKRYYHA